MLCRGIVLLLSMNNKFIALSRIITILSTWLERITWQHFILVEFLLFLQHEQHEVAEQETLFWKSNIKSTGIIAEEESQEQAVTVFVIKGSKSC